MWARAKAFKTSNLSYFLHTSTVKHWLSFPAVSKQNTERHSRFLLVQIRSSTFPLWDTDTLQWSNVQRKAQFPPAYRCSISSSMLPEIDGVRGWTKASDWKAINYFFAVEGDITIRLVGWLGPQAELSSTCLYDRRGGDWGARGYAWLRISINSGAGNVSLSLFLSLSHAFHILSFFHQAYA